MRHQIRSRHSDVILLRSYQYARTARENMFSMRSQAATQIQKTITPDSSCDFGRKHHQPARQPISRCVNARDRRTEPLQPLVVCVEYIHIYQPVVKSLVITKTYLEPCFWNPYLGNMTSSVRALHVKLCGYIFMNCPYIYMKMNPHDANLIQSIFIIYAL